MNKTPTSVLVLSIIGLILGGLGILGLILVIGLQLVKFGPRDPMTEALQKDAVYVAISLISSGIGLILGMLCVASCIGSFSLRPWARKGMCIYAWGAMAQAVLGGLYTMFYVYPKMAAALPAAAPPGYRAGVVGGMIGGGCGMVLGLIYPICVLYFYSRPHVVDAFNGIFPASPTNFPVEFPR